MRTFDWKRLALEFSAVGMLVLIAEAGVQLFDWTRIWAMATVVVVWLCLISWVQSRRNARQP